ncbi:MAG TPA: site-specific integrase [Bacteroidia bacterium]|jgi:integrase|nr:site-specific integrase [Bacteroidia bacterium]
MQNTFNIIFYPKRTKLTKDGKNPIYARVTINGERVEFSSQREIEPGQWNRKMARAKGQTAEALSLNTFLESFRTKIYDHYRELLDLQLPVNGITLKKQFMGIRDDQKTILDVFAHHNKQVNSRVGHEYAAATASKFKSTFNHLQAFIIHKYSRKDFPANQIDHEFIHEFDYYMKNVKKCNHNSALKYVKLFRKIVLICSANGWIEKDPFANFKSKVKPTERDFLTKQELRTLEEYQFPMQRLGLVRDIFVFSCYTGLAYIDVAKLTPHDLVHEKDETWIHIFRTKTNGRTQVPLLPKAAEIIAKYADHPVSSTKNRLLPAFSNQKMNAYLKEISDLCEIRKHLTFHTD